MTSTSNGSLVTLNLSSPSGTDSSQPSPNDLREKHENQLFEDWMLAKDERTRRETQDRLCRLLRNHIQGVIYQRLQHPDQDLAQHIAMEILRGIHRFRGESKFSTWAHEVAKRQIALHLREKYSNREDITPEGIIEVSDDPTEALENQMLFDRIADALPEEDRALLNAKRDGLDSEQIAQILGVSQATVWQRWLRLQEKIRKEFAR